MNHETAENQNDNLPVKFLVVGRTASGKSSIVRNVCEKLGLKQVKSMTTRPKRTSEDNENCDHYFVTDEEFDEKEKNGLAAYTKINDYRYATTFDELDKSDIYVIDPDGIRSLKQTCSDRYRFIEIYIRVPFNISKTRFKQRGGTDIEFKRRYDQESTQFKEYEEKQMFDYHVLNDQKLEDAVNSIIEIIKKNHK